MAVYLSPAMYAVCPLCEEGVSKCFCGSLTSPKTDSSCSLRSEPEQPLCSQCDEMVINCNCDFQLHDIAPESGLCLNCGLIDPQNQLCGWSKPIADSFLADTPVRKNNSKARRQLFKSIPTLSASTIEGQDGFLRGDFEVYQVKAFESCNIGIGETALITTNVIFPPQTEKAIGFFTVVNIHPGYWLYNPLVTTFVIKEGVLPTNFTGTLNISVLNKSDDQVTIMAGTSLGCLQFHRFI